METVTCGNICNLDTVKNVLNAFRIHYQAMNFYYFKVDLNLEKYFQLLRLNMEIMLHHEQLYYDHLIKI